MSSRSPWFLFATAISCAADEAPRVTALVTVDATRLPSVMTDLGWSVTVTEARAALTGLQFTVAGEVHTASVGERILDLVIPRASAHPGHYLGGEVTGELTGRFVVDWLAEAPQTLGQAILLEGTYDAANFTLDRASGLPADDALLGHTARFVGVAVKATRTVHFDITVDSPAGRQIVGVPCLLAAESGTTPTLTLQLQLVDGLEKDTLFDGLDFGALDTDGDGSLVVSEAGPTDAYNLFRRTFQTHDHFNFSGK
jgi:hypothetical protein